MSCSRNSIKLSGISSNIRALETSRDDRDIGRALSFRRSGEKPATTRSVRRHRRVLSACPASGLSVAGASRTLPRFRFIRDDFSLARARR